MSSWRPKRCKTCGRTKADGWQISKQGYCLECGLAAVARAIVAMSSKGDRAYERWLANPRSRIGRPGPRGVGGTTAPNQPSRSSTSETSGV